MELGYRIIRPDDAGKYPLRFAQISLWREANWGVAEGEEAVRQAIEIARTCKAQGIRTVFHPLEYPMAGELASRTVDVLRRLAAVPFSSCPQSLPASESFPMSQLFT